MSVEFLRRLPLFASVGEDDLNWLLAQAEYVDVAAGELLIEEGGPGDSMFIVLEGEFEIIKRSDVQNIVIAVRDSGAVIGEMALLDQAPRMASVRAVRDSRLIKIHDHDFHQLLSTSPSAALAILHTVSGRLRQNDAMLRQNEKMAALGTLSAGLAHELNNPAAAVRRGASQLRQSLDDLQTLAARLAATITTDDQRQHLERLRADITARVANPSELDALSQADVESQWQTWLEDHGAENAWEIAPLLAAFGWHTDALDTLDDLFAPDQLTLLAAWIAVSSSTYSLLNEVHTGAERISEIVKAVKSYSYLDQAPILEVDLHEGLDNTLIILRHKIKSGVKIKRDYAPDLPRIEGYGSELNQVWTNIIDNAIDAMQGQGEIIIRTYKEESKDEIVVELIDNGPGVPPEIQPRIFEPFFTTKAPGVGTGLGLHIAYSIINKHGGQIRLFSEPGKTCFRVTLPLQLRSRAS